MHLIDLAGPWRFQLDPHNRGLRDAWQRSTLPGTVTLPGSLPGQGIGDPVTLDTPWMGEIKCQSWFTAPENAKYLQPGNFKFSFWLQPETYYAGAAWYQRVIEIPRAWQGRRVVLSLERPHWQTHVWLDGQPVGSCDSLSTPHEYDLGQQLSPGPHTLTLRVDNSLVVDIGINSHSITDHTQGNWNGVVGAISLRATAAAWIEDLQVYPHASSKSITVRGRVMHRDTALPGSAQLAVAGVGELTQGQAFPAKEIAIAADGTFTAEYSMGDSAQLWDEFSPALYRLTCTLPGGESRAVSFGLRDLATRGTQFTLNGRPLYFRGTLECCIFPKTGHPPTDVDSWMRILGIARAHGLNMLRFHSWCPPEAAFVAADEMGMYYQVEAASWANTSTTLGDGKPVDAWLYAETERILKAYGNHPSFLLMPYGNEPNYGSAAMEKYLTQWVSHFQKLDPRRLFTSGSGWPELPVNPYHVTPHPRIYTWGHGLKARINAQPPETCTDYRAMVAQRKVPIISHEIGEWCAYPNFEEIAKYTGYLKPRNFEIFRDSLAEHGMLDQAREFLLASGKLQTLCYKEEIEASLRTPGLGGFQLLDLHDFPGQGTALVGVLDAFWESKGYVTAEEFRRFCSPTVPLARLAKRALTQDETLEASVEVAHFGPASLPDAVVAWSLVNDAGVALAHGTLPPRELPTGQLTPFGTVRVPLGNLPAPARVKLVLKLQGTAFENDWDLWVYPAAIEEPTPKDLRITATLDDAAKETLERGGTVLLLPEQIAGDARGPVGLGFSSIFWNTVWTDGQLPHTLGIWCDPKHPALAEFPTDSHSNWQWWYVIYHAKAMILDGMPALRPIVQVVDDWVTNRKLGLAFECRYGRGRLLVCSVDLRQPDDPVRRQLWQSLLRYLTQEAPANMPQISPAQLSAIIPGEKSCAAHRSP